MKTLRHPLPTHLWLIAVVAGLTAGCVQDQKAPDIAGPSELALSLSLSAAPEVLSRDGSSTSTITVRARGADGAPLANQRLIIQTTAGSVSVGEINTGADGRAQFTYIAPGLNTNVTDATIGVSPIQGTDAANLNTRTVRIVLLGPGFPVAKAAFSPPNPASFQLVTFSAAASTLDGAICGDACSYSWVINGTTLNGSSVTYRFPGEGAYDVVLTVTSLSSGTTNTTTITVPVGTPVKPTPVITFSPTSPHPGDSVRFDGTGSTAAQGATISSYLWDFGNGQTGTGERPAPVIYALEGTYVVRLTVTDSNGVTATTTTEVDVAP